MFWVGEWTGVIKRRWRSTKGGGSMRGAPGESLQHVVVVECSVNTYRLRAMRVAR